MLALHGPKATLQASGALPMPLVPDWILDAGEALWNAERAGATLRSRPCGASLDRGAVPEGDRVGRLPAAIDRALVLSALNESISHA